MCCAWVDEEVTKLTGLDRSNVTDERLLRSSVSLSPDDFVFCSFNAASKFEPATYRVWMNILRRVPRSVLWLMKYPGNPSAPLREAAAGHGIDPARLIFFTLFPKDSHIRFKGLCHLMLDSPMYNGQRTMLDAVWADVPVVTMPLVRPYARIAASYMLPNKALQHLIARTDDEYEELAVALATQPEAYAMWRSELILTRDSLPALQVANFVHRQLTQQLRSMWDTHVNVGTQYHIVRSSREPCGNDHAGRDVALERGWHERRSVDAAVAETS
jgi:protein O-GlcNAc transferase